MGSAIWLQTTKGKSTLAILQKCKNRQTFLQKYARLSSQALPINENKILGDNQGCWVASVAAKITKNLRERQNPVCLKRWIPPLYQPVTKGELHLDQAQNDHDQLSTLSVQNKNCKLPSNKSIGSGLNFPTHPARLLLRGTF